MQCHCFTKCARLKLKYGLDIRFSASEAGRNSIANRTPNHIDVCNAVDNFLDVSEWCPVHDNRETGLFTQPTPAIYIVLHKWDLRYNRQSGGYVPIPE